MENMMIAEMSEMTGEEVYDGDYGGEVDEFRECVIRDIYGNGEEGEAEYFMEHLKEWRDCLVALHHRAVIDAIDVKAELAEAKSMIEIDGQSNTQIRKWKHRYLDATQRHDSIKAFDARVNARLGQVNPLLRQQNKASFPSPGTKKANKQVRDEGYQEGYYSGTESGWYSAVQALKMLMLDLRMTREDAFMVAEYFDVQMLKPWRQTGGKKPKITAGNARDLLREAKSNPPLAHTSHNP